MPCEGWNAFLSFGLGGTRIMQQETRIASAQSPVFLK